MENRFNKIEFTFFLFLSSLRFPWKRKGIQDRLIRIANESYRVDFNRIPVAEKAVLLPHCLVHRKCPARFSKEDGILCTKCQLCRCGEIKALCEERGFQFYITPSSGFTKRLAERKRLKAAVGATCPYEIERGLRSTRITLKGIDLRQRKVVPQVIVMPKYDCLDNDVDWEFLKRIILRGA